MGKKTTYNSTSRPGFTIVELLIVVVVIAILAAITVVAYNGITRRASESAASNAASQAKKKIGVWQVENPSQSPDQATFSLILNGATTGLEYSPGVNGTYCITSTSGGVSYTVTDSTNVTSGGCPGHAQGGTAAITNLHINPGAVTTAGYGAWDGGSGNTISTGVAAAGWAQSGSAYRIIWNTVGGVNGDIQTHLNTGSVLTAGTTYTVRFNVTPGQNSSISAPGPYASAGVASLVARSTSSDTALTSGTPTTFWVTFQADTTALTSGLRIVMNPRAKVAGHSYFISDTVIYEGGYNGAIGFYWGNSPNWLWNGTVNNSTSKGPPL